MNSTPLPPWKALLSLTLVGLGLACPLSAEPGDLEASLVAVDSQAYESGDPALVRVTLSAPSAAGLTVDYSIAGTATSGVDFVALDGSVTLSPGATEALIPITPLATADVEADEHLTLRLQPAAGYVLGESPVATVWLFDHGPSNGTTYFVSPSGDDSRTGTSEAEAFQTIQRAADVVQAGDVVYVMDGRYHNPGFTNDHGGGTTALENPNLAVLGASGTPDSYITIRSYPDGNGVKPQLVYDGAGGLKIASGVSHLVIDGFELEGPSRHITYEEAVADRWTKSKYFSGRGIYTWGPAHHIYVKNCDSRHAPGSGIRFNRSDYIVVQGCEVSNCTWWTSSAESGLVLAKSEHVDTLDAVKMLYTGNTVYNNWNQLPFCNPSSQGSGEYGDGFNFQGGRIIDGMGLYITLNRATYAHGRMRMENNISFNNGINGIVYHHTDRGELLNNVCYMNGAWPGTANFSGLTINTADDVKIHNNILWARSGTHFALKDNGSATNIDVRNNNIFVGQSQWNNVDGSSGDPRFLQAVDLTAFTPQNHGPDQVGAAVMDLGLDLHIQEGSAAIDAGIAAGAPSGDLDGDDRPAGAGVDVGADEFLPMGPDCDDDGIPDAEEIASGASQDCNGDEVPDECELASDPGLDQNSNGILDECECGVSSYCVTSTNSVGPGCEIGWQGSLQPAANAFTLTASGAPPTVTGLFLCGGTQGQAVFGEGVLCVASPTMRIMPWVATDAGGLAALTLDFTQPPFDAGTFQVSPFETWNFQFWYRDPQGGPVGFNFSDGLQATFCP